MNVLNNTDTADLQTLIQALVASIPAATKQQLIHQQIAPLSDSDAAFIVDGLKAEADRHWYIDATVSLDIGCWISQIGAVRQDNGQVALGLMVQGDALKLIGQLEEAWTRLDEAGRLFLTLDDEVGWARTRIGRVYITSYLTDRLEVAMHEAETAREIFTRHGLELRLLSLENNMGTVYSSTDHKQQALRLFQTALDRVGHIGEAAKGYAGPLYANIGLVYTDLGDYRQALAHYTIARGIYADRGETRGIAIAELTIAFIAQLQGQYRYALQLLQRSQRVFQTQPHSSAIASRIMVECYNALNRYPDAIALAHQAITDFKALGILHEVGATLFHLAIAEAALNHLAEAQGALDEAEPIFNTFHQPGWFNRSQLLRGQFALKQGDYKTALKQAQAAAAGFEVIQEQAYRIKSLLLEGQALRELGDLPAALALGHEALRFSQQGKLPPIRYAAHLLLGTIQESQGHVTRALRHYQAAAATIDHVQRGLTITLRTNFLEDKNEPLRALLRLQLASRPPVQAFETLERSKVQVWFDYLTNREQLLWRQDDPDSTALIVELDALRAEHHGLYQASHEPAPPSDSTAPGSGKSPAARPDHSLKIAELEQRMRQITEQLYMRSAGNDPLFSTKMPSPAELQARLDGGGLIAFYNDGQQWWAFTLDNAAEVVVHRLSLSVTQIDRLIGNLQFNVACALQVTPDSPTARALTVKFNRLAQQLYDGLLAPLAPYMADHYRLTIVPYGALHYLPFHLLHTGRDYLTAAHEVVILPSASLLTHPAPNRADGGALAIACSRGGLLTETLAEAEAVQAVFSAHNINTNNDRTSLARVYSEAGATRAVLQSAPGQVLHIAAHGEYRIDQPEWSYIQLADGPLYTDDLLQLDLGYELVTLSACETGRARVTAGEELIGLGRGFLYAGAGALIVSLWRVSDVLMVGFMTELYQALRGGAAKPAAIRQAQQYLRDHTPDLHPAFWGAFQLMGNPDPLSR